MKLKSVAKGVYQAEDGRFYERPSIGGRRTTRLLKAVTLKEAVNEHAAEMHAPRQSFDRLVEDWLEAGCPDKANQPRSDVFCARARALLKHPVAYFGHIDVSKIKPSLISEYGAWRSKRVVKTQYDGRRSADIELATCASMCWWAYFRDRVATNPFAVKFRFHKSADVKHSPERAPRSAEEVHAIGERLISHPRTASSGFLWLFLALTGTRTKEMRLLRTDLEPVGQKLPPGWHSDSEIVIERGKKRGKDALDVLRLSEPAKDLLKAWENWHSTRYPYSPWWFPGRGGGAPLDVSSLTRSVKKAARDLGLNDNISAHGCRSFYCSVLRTIEPDDRRVADALGHTNVTMVCEVYGRRSLHTDGLSWVPKSGKVGWEKWRKKEDFKPMAPIKI